MSCDRSLGEKKSFIKSRIALCSGSQSATTEVVANAVFTTQPVPAYNDLPELKYHFSKSLFTASRTDYR
jgi:hypothetical protein